MEAVGGMFRDGLPQGRPGMDGSVADDCLRQHDAPNNQLCRVEVAVTRSNKGSSVSGPASGTETLLQWLEL